MGPNRVNRAHWPTKENRQNFDIFWIFPAHTKNGPGGPQMGRGRFFLGVKKTLPTFWAERILILRILFFWIFLGSQISGLGPLGPSLGPPTWAQFGPIHVGPAWAQPLGPSVGPATWAQTPAPPAPPDEFSDPNLTPLPGMNHAARSPPTAICVFPFILHVLTHHRLSTFAKSVPMMVAFTRLVRYCRRSGGMVR